MITPIKTTPIEKGCIISSISFVWQQVNLDLEPTQDCYYLKTKKYCNYRRPY